MDAPTATPQLELDAQYRELREGAARVERERGFIFVTGEDAADYLQGQLTNDIEALAEGDGCYSALLDRKGRMQADMVVLRFADRILLITEPAGHGAAVKHLTMYAIGRDVSVSDAIGSRAIVSVIGPATFERTGAAPLGAECRHARAEIGPFSGGSIRTDIGLDLACPIDELPALHAALEHAGIPLAGEDAAEIIRVEDGRPRFGAEMTTATIPQEAGINERAVSFTKGCYIGQETVARLHYKGKPNRRLLGLRLAAPAEGGDELALSGKGLGTIGTAVVSPAHGPVGLAIVRREAGPGDEVEVGADNRASLVELPFG